MSGVTAVSPLSYAGYTAQLSNAGGAQAAAAQAQPAYDPDHDGDTDQPGHLDVKV